MSTGYLCTAMTKTPGEHVEGEGFISEPSGVRVGSLAPLVVTSCGKMLC